MVCSLFPYVRDVGVSQGYPGGGPYCPASALPLPFDETVVGFRRDPLATAKRDSPDGLPATKLVLAEALRRH